MGTSAKHKTIVITGFELTKITTVHKKAKEIFKQNTFKGFGDLSSLVSEINYGRIYSFFIAPNGAKEGGDRAMSCVNANEEFLDWLDEFESFIEYVEIQFGDDLKRNKEVIIRSSNNN